ncbi:2-hydroxychromene-2-carboxylate isomerase [Phenylobacterium haematophilum]|uniref:2-hydroxychromene-2-carboxylate isomerase n=1 Tax=Phenylobacterium haematophilum TaxID=98513 RepID=A0A839ZV33_9CAUL|nr:2-hydroxychromene-2-carboxylate isomerase [Phenylobacterium haematophilum]MBB3889904.1 2-hydroxychromene-2-carboxylate isomerase [Phenylobacterium haematophilum]
MTKTVEFIFDFGSPNAYLAYGVLKDIAARTGAEVVLTPCLLGGLFKITGNQAPMTAFGGIQGKLAYEALETKRFVAKHKLDRYQFNPHFPVNTLLIMRGLVAARRLGVEQAYLDAVMAGMWERGLKMDDPQVVAAALTEAGLDAEAILAATQEPEVKAELLANTERAAARGAFGIPTFFVGDEMFFGKERLGQVEEELAA